MPEREGVGRRVGDGHCDNHEQNTKDIAAMKSSFSTLKWVIGLCAPFLVICLSVLGIILTDIREDGKKTKEVVQSNAIVAVSTQTEVKYLSSRMGEIEDDHRNKGIK